MTRATAYGRVKDDTYRPAACFPNFSTKRQLPSRYGLCPLEPPLSGRTASSSIGRKAPCERAELTQHFSDLGLAAPLLATIKAQGYDTPTPIQAKAIPHILEGRDLIGIAQTGTGKTAAFALPILTHLLADRHPAPRGGCRVLVLSPTRELASQIADSFRSYSAGLGFSVVTVFGGVSYSGQTRALARGIDVLVAAPGRLVDHLDQGVADLRGTEILVLDEVDQMLDLGFVKPIRRIVRDMAFRRQNLFFSATMPKEIRSLAVELLKDPVEVAVTPAATTVERIEQSVLLVETSRKRTVLADLFSQHTMTRAIVFTRTKHGADRVAQHLERVGITAQAIHGNKSQNQRERALETFRSGAARALVATDVAARGIDIDGVTHVVNFDLPDVAERYVHRIGRTARAGADGAAISLCDSSERGMLADIEKLTRQRLPTQDLRLDGAAEDAAQTSAADRKAKARKPGPGRRGPAVKRRSSQGNTARPASQPSQASQPAAAAQTRQAAPSQPAAKPQPNRKSPPNPAAKGGKKRSGSDGRTPAGASFMASLPRKRAS